MPGLGHAVGRVGEGRARRGGADLPQPQLAGEQVGPHEAQRPREQEQQVVAHQCRDGAGAQEGGGTVAQQGVREGQAQRMRIERVGVEDVQRVVQHRVAYPRHLPGGAYGVPEVGRDPAGQVQHQRPARDHGEQHAGQRHPGELRPPERRRGRPGFRSRRRVRPSQAAGQRALARGTGGRAQRSGGSARIAVSRLGTGRGLGGGGRRAGRTDEAGAHPVFVSGAARIAAAYGSEEPHQPGTSGPAGRRLQTAV